MRGKELFQDRIHLNPGITPAHAGKSLNHFSSDEKLQDHPRTCGEKSDNDTGDKFFNGSPPHMRGKVFQ